MYTGVDILLAYTNTRIRMLNVMDILYMLYNAEIWEDRVCSEGEHHRE